MTKIKIKGVHQGLQYQNMLFRLTGADTGGAFDYAYCVVDYLKGPVVHIHKNEDELIHIVSGQLCFQINEEMIEATLDDVIFIPKGIAHTYINLHQTPATLYSVYSPGTFYQFMQAWEHLSLTSPKPEELTALMRQYNQVVLGPPLVVTMGLVK